MGKQERNSGLGGVRLGCKYSSSSVCLTLCLGSSALSCVSAVCLLRTCLVFGGLLVYSHARFTLKMSPIMPKCLTSTHLAIWPSVSWSFCHLTVNILFIFSISHCHCQFCTDSSPLCKCCYLKCLKTQVLLQLLIETVAQKH